MKKLALLVVLTLTLTALSGASVVTYSGCTGTMCATVNFTLFGNVLDVDFANTGTGLIQQMTFRGPALTLLSEPAGWNYAFGMFDFSRSNAVFTTSAFDGTGGSEDFTFTVPAGFNLAMVGNAATNDGIRWDYLRTTAYVEGYKQSPTPEPAGLALLGGGVLGLASWLRRKAINV